MTWPRRTASILGFLLLFHATPARPQDAPEEIRNDTDPTKPVFFTLRNEYYNLRNEPWQNVVILRADRLVLNRVGLFGKSRGFLLRTDLPAVTVHDGKDTRSGLGDLYAQALVIPKFTKSFTIAWGSGVVFPTATNSVGSDKWQLAPVVAPVVFFGRLKGLGFIKFQNFFSIAGEDDRPDLNYFLVTPTILRRISRSWWIVVDSESRTDWVRDNTTSFKSGIQVGKMMSPRFGVWVKPEIPWGQNRLGDWTVKATAILTRY